MQAEPALRVPREELGEIGRVALRLRLRERPPEHTHHRNHLQQQQIERDLRNLATGKPDDEVPAAEAEAAKGRFSVATAHWIVDDIDAAPRRDLADALAQVRGGIINECVCAVLASERELLL